MGSSCYQWESVVATWLAGHMWQFPLPGPSAGQWWSPCGGCGPARTWSQWPPASWSHLPWYWQCTDNTQVARKEVLLIKIKRLISTHYYWHCKVYFKLWETWAISYLKINPRILTHLNWRTVTLVGHSMGGGLCQLYTAAFPELVTRLVMLDICHMPRRPVTLQDDIISRYQLYSCFVFKYLWWKDSLEKVFQLYMFVEYKIKLP